MSSDQTMLEIAQTAARMVVEDGLEWRAAKLRAVRQLGLPARTSLPSNDLLAALRRLALVWMERLEQFRPHLAGAVWHGTATRTSDIYLQLFCDDSKTAEITLINQHVKYEPSTVTGFTGMPVEALSIHALCKPLNESVGVHLMVYDLDDLRGALKPDAKGRSPRGSTQALKRLLQDSDMQKHSDDGV